MASLETLNRGFNSEHETEISIDSMKFDAIGNPSLCLCHKNIYVSCDKNT